MQPATLVHNAGHSAGTPKTGVYQSRMIERYLGFLARCEKPRVLDIGPVCGGTIDFFLERGARIYVGDMLKRFGPQVIQNIQPENLRSFFDYDAAVFDAVNVWDIPDHLYQSSLHEMVKQCCRVLKPNGLLMTINANSTAVQPFAHYFVIGEKTNVALRRNEENRLPYYFRSNRDIDLAFKPLEQLCSFVYMNGIREFLFKKPF